MRIKQIAIVALSVSISFFTMILSAESARTRLTLEQRVSYQRAIEEVYWRHTIWPEFNPQPKPPLSAVMSEKDIRNKVEQYLSKSTSLVLTSQQLQAEIDRMANESRDPEILKELWAALGNNPYVIAECLARPLLVDRIPHTSHNFSLHASFSDYYLPNIKVNEFHPSTSLALASNTWTATNTTGAPSARAGHTAVWTGTQMIIWGGIDSTNTGARYNPSTNSWSATALAGAPSGRQNHTAVWTGTRMIVWGGTHFDIELKSGGLYNPSTNSWTATTTTGAPSGRFYHTAVWSGTVMIIWGGASAFDGFNTGGRYNPSTNTWAATSTAGAPSARILHTAVWAGTQLIVWGGMDRLGSVPFNTGGRYNPSTDSWTATSTSGAPSARRFHTAVWTGTQMIIWGGGSGSNGITFNNGARYNPSTNSWITISTTGAPSSRQSHTAVWTGTRMIIWGGNKYGAPPNYPLTFFNTGAQFNLSTNTWTATTTNAVPSPRNNHTAVWTGTQMIIWGGFNNTLPYLRTGGRYVP